MIVSLHKVQPHSINRSEKSRYTTFLTVVSSMYYIFNTFFADVECSKCNIAAASLCTLQRSFHGRTFLITGAFLQPVSKK